MNGSLEGGKEFDLSKVLDDKTKIPEILEQYKQNVKKEIAEGNNPFIGAVIFDLWDFAGKALEKGEKDIALEVMRNIAEYSVPSADALYKMQNAKRSDKPIPFTFDFLSKLKNDMSEKMVSCGLSKEMEELEKTYKSRPEIASYLNAQEIAATRKRLAKRIDGILHTNLKNVKLPNKLDNFVANVVNMLPGKNKGKD